MMQKKVTFQNNEHDMAGILFFPDDFDETKQYAAFPVAIASWSCEGTNCN